MAWDVMYMLGWAVTSVAAFGALLLHEGIPETFGDWVVALVCAVACIALGSLWPGVWGILLLALAIRGLQMWWRK